MILLRMLFLPFFLIYGLIIWIRNKCFDWKLFKSNTYDFPLIAVGNLSSGGTGKTPHVEYLLYLLSEYPHKATLSRGYGRKSKGYKIVDSHASATLVGDEPLQYAKKFEDVIVAVHEDRVKGIAQLKQEGVDLVLLDDAFQHRSVKPGLNILLTTYSKLYINDFLLPIGTLREGKAGAQRADIIVVTKSPKAFLPVDKKRLVEQLSPWPHQHLCFSYYDYADPVYLFKGEKVSLQEQQIVLLTGIANAQSIKDYLIGKVALVNHLKYKDHHQYTRSDIKKILSVWESVKSSNKLLLTTEKDAMRLHEYKDLLQDIPICFLPVNVRFHEKDKFDNLVLEYVRKNKRNS